MKVLSNLILKNIFLYLLNKNKFKQVLEYSLISKACFSIIQNLLTFDNDCIMVKMTFDSIKSYIENSKLQLSNNKFTPILMKRKLLQFKEIEQLVIFYDDNNNNKNNENNENNENNNNKGLKRSEYNYLINNFKNLKRIYSESSKFAYFPSYQYYNDLVDYNKVCKIYIKKLYINWFYFGPISSSREHQLYSNSPHEESIYFKFSFEFLSHYNPKKLIISTPNHQIQNNFYNLNNILNCKSIKSIYFKNIQTPNSLIKKVFSETNIKSFKIILDNNNNNNDNDNENENDNGFILNRIENNNFKLKKLVIKKFDFFNNNSKKEEGELNEQNKFLNEICLKNYNLKYIGLEFFVIKESNQLNQLFNLKFLNTISCSNDSFIAVIQHCNENKNIKTLKYHNKVVVQLIPEDFKIFDGFFKSNKTLEDFRIFYYYPHLERSFLRVKKILSDSKNKTIKNFEIKEVTKK
ncbi:hypothetical protein ACTFIR_006778 [Dictyostelium discoideum]